MAHTTWDGCHIVNANEDISKGHYLKLHGSLNWLKCTNSKCSVYGAPMAVDALGLQLRSRDSKCYQCGFELEPLLIPPAYRKRFDEASAIAKQWRIALDEIAKATGLVIIGYSFPKTDLSSLWLLQAGAMRYNQNDLRITVVASESDQEHYEGLLNDKLNRSKEDWIFYPGFSAYVDAISDRV